MKQTFKVGQEVMLFGDDGKRFMGNETVRFFGRVDGQIIVYGHLIYNNIWLTSFDEKSVLPATTTNIIG